MDKSKAEAYEVIGNIICKMILVVAVIGGWLVMVFFLVKDPNIPLGIATSNIPLLMTMLIQHFFPKRR